MDHDPGQKRSGSTETDIDTLRAEITRLQAELRLANRLLAVCGRCRKRGVPTSDVHPQTPSSADSNAISEQPK